MNARILIACLSLLVLANAEASQKITLAPGADFPAQLDKAIAAVNAGEASVLAFASGEFRIAKPLVFRLPFGHPGLRLHGAAPGLTRLIFSDCATGISVTLDTGITHAKTSPAISIDSLSLIATGKCGTAIDLHAGDPNHRGGVAAKMFHSLSIEGKKGSWTTGIYVNDLSFCTFRDLTIRLPRKNTTGIHLTGKSSPVDHHLTGLRTLGCQTGLRVSGTTEGVYVTQLTMIGCDIGIDWDTTSHEPLLALTGSHINARSTCVRARNLLQPLITSNLFYQADPQTAWTGLHVRTEKSTAFDLLQISNNTFHGHPKRTQANNGLIINAASTAVLQGNIFSALDTGISLGEQAKELTPTGSVFKNTPIKIAR